MQLQERQIRKRLSDAFEPHIDMSDCLKHATETQDKMRTSRALAAFSLAANAKLAVKEACASVTDESGDQGLDAVGVAAATGEVFVIQAKTGKGGPSPTDVGKFCDGIRLVLDWDWQSLGSKVSSRREQIEKALEEGARVVAIYTHLGSEEPNDDANRHKDRLLAEVNSAGDILEFRFQGLRDNFELRNVPSGMDPLDFELSFDQWATLGDYRSEILGVVTGSQLAEMVETFDERLFDKNIRSILRATETNEAIVETVRTDPDQFWYYNNGITVVASEISCQRTRPRPTNESFLLRGMSVVNGAQTCGALARAAQEGCDLEQVSVTVRVISTAQRSENFENLVTRYTNTQNQITSREFVALDALQQELSDTLREEKIQYTYRTGQSPTDDAGEFSFDLEEATRALACWTGIRNATRAKREIGKMWSDLHAAPYRELFPKNLDAPVLYNCVRFWRKIGEEIKRRVEDLEARENRILENASYVACTIMMERAKRNSVDFSDLDADLDSWFAKYQTTLDSLCREIITLHEERNPGGYPLAFFKNVQKVEEFADALRRVPL